MATSSLCVPVHGCMSGFVVGVPADCSHGWRARCVIGRPLGKGISASAEGRVETLNDPKRRRRCALPSQSKRRTCGRGSVRNSAVSERASVLECGGKRSATPLWILQAWNVCGQSFHGRPGTIQSAGACRAGRGRRDCLRLPSARSFMECVSPVALLGLCSFIQKRRKLPSEAENHDKTGEADASATRLSFHVSR